MIRLTVKQGSIVQTLNLDREKVFVGRLDSNHVRISDPSVSRKHCMIRRTTDGDLEVLDLNSRHGTHKNGSSVERADLSIGDEIGVGEVVIFVEDPGTAVADVAVPRGKTGERTEGTPAREKKELVSDAFRVSYSERLYRQMVRVPWWALSLCVHVLSVYFLFQVEFQPARGTTPFGSLTGSLAEDYGADPEEDPVKTAEEMLEELSRAEEDVALPEINEVPPSLSAELEPEEEEEEPQLADIGPSLDARPMPLARKGTVSNPEVPEGDFGQDSAEEANRQAMDLLRKSLRASGGDSVGTLERLAKRDVLVVSGHYDKVETVLDLLGLKHEICTVRRLERVNLSRRKALFINCSNVAPSRDAIERIREFVEDGGYLISSDWSVENVLKWAFRGYIEPVMRRGRNVITPNEVIRVQIAGGAKDHFLLRGTTIAQGGAKWWLEESSYPFRVVKHGSVQVLIESEDLERKFGARHVAATFKYGKGRVLHMLGHFFQKEGNLKGAFSAQRLIANFLIAAVRKK